MNERFDNYGDVLSQSKLYDKVVKENMHQVLPVLIRDILGINIVSKEDLAESVQHTRESIPDQLCKVTDTDGNTYILHIEWQSDDDPSMDNRMLSYRAMLRRKHGLHVKQYVIFLARATSDMPCNIDEENLKFSYHLIALQQFNHRIFLDSTSPEQKLLAIFGNFENTPPVEVIREIIQDVTKIADGKLNANRYVQQLRTLVQLRKLNNEFKTAMGTITNFKVEEDAFYIDGLEKGEERGLKKGEKKGVEKNNKKVIENLIVKYNFSDEQAANATDTSISFVRQLREQHNWR